MTKYGWFHQGIIGVLSSALLLTAVGCSTPLSKREKGALMGGGTGAATGGALGAGGGVLVGDQLQKQDHWGQAGALAPHIGT